MGTTGVGMDPRIFPVPAPYPSSLCPTLTMSLPNFLFHCPPLKMWCRALPKNIFKFYIAVGEFKCIKRKKQLGSS